jgi:hypothetical protein
LVSGRVLTGEAAPIAVEFVMLVALVGRDRCFLID